MTPKLSLITAAVAGAALLLAAPAIAQVQPQQSPDAADATVATAPSFNYLGADWAGSASSSSPNRSPDVVDAALADTPSFNYVGSTYMDTNERSTTFAPDALERAVANTLTQPNRVISGDDHIRLDPADLPTYVPTTTTSGREVEWPQIGIGLGLGMFLTLSVLLAMRSTRVRRLAH